MSNDPSQLPLRGVRVLDLCSGPGELASRFLGDLGADVIRLEEAQTCSEDPYFRSVHSANKRSICLDLEDEHGQRTFWALAATCDIVFENSRPTDRRTSGINPQELYARLPHLVVVSLTHFGQDGPYRDWEGSDDVHFALSGILSRSGLPGKAPLLPPTGLATESASLQAAWSALVAYSNKLDTGLGDLVDASIFESTAQTLDPGWGIGGSATGGVPASNGPRGRPDARHLYPIFRCVDGYVRICILAPRQWQGMFRWLGEPAEFADPALASLANRFAASERIYSQIGELFAGRGRESIIREAQDFGVPAAALLTFGEVLDAEHYAERRLFTRVEVDGADVSIANGFAEIDGVRAGVRSAAPVRGAHTAELMAELTAERLPTSLPPEGRAPSAHCQPPPRRLPLEGVRVLDLGVIVVGAELSRLLADMGAEVIKVENKAFPDGSRQSSTGALMSPSFAWGHRNKTSLGLNLRDPAGITLFKDLVAASDVVLSNFKPGTLESLGLGYDVLAQINPGIVMADSSAFGPTGPSSPRMGYGPLVRAEAGLTSLWAYPQEDGSFSDASTIYPDHVAARVGAATVMSLLLRRRRTGAGGTVSIAQSEVIIGQLATHFARESARPGSVRTADDLRSPDAPRGVFKCAGDDEWVVIDVLNDKQFVALTEVIGQPQLAADPRYGSSAQRAMHRVALDGAVSEWTAQQAPRSVAQALQTAGVPSAPMQRVADLLEDPHLRERSFYRLVGHPLMDQPIPHEGHPAKFTAIGEVPLRPAPLSGADSRAVLASVLLLKDPDINDLVASGIVEEPEPAGIPAPV